MSEAVFSFEFSADMLDTRRRSVEMETNELVIANASTREEIANENRISQEMNNVLLQLVAKIKSNKRKATDLFESTGRQEHLVQPLATAATLLTDYESQNKQSKDGTSVNCAPNTTVPFSLQSAPAFLHKDTVQKRVDAVDDHKAAVTDLYAVQRKQQRRVLKMQTTEENICKAQKLAHESGVELEYEQKSNSKYIEALDLTRSGAAKLTDEEVI